MAAQGDYKPKPFAVMRMTHEAIRVGMDDLNERCAGDASGDASAALTKAFDDLTRLVALHSKQEDDVFFPMLDEKFDNGAKNAGWGDEHAQDQAAIDAIRDAIEAKDDGEALRKAATAWTEQHEAHLKNEDANILPFVNLMRADDDFMATACAAVGRMLDVDRDSFGSFQFAYVVDKLNAKRKFGQLRNFVDGVRICSSDEQWTSYRDQIGAIVGDDTWAKLGPLVPAP